MLVPGFEATGNVINYGHRNEAKVEFMVSAMGPCFKFSLKYLIQNLIKILVDFI